MAVWKESPDPVSQAESRRAPLSGGVISKHTVVYIPASLYQALEKSNPEVKSVFDLLAMRMSHVFPQWKGTRYDFRFASQDGTRVLSLVPRIRYVRAEISTGNTGYRNSKNLFPKIIPPKSEYPGTWRRAMVATLNEAKAIAEDVETDCNQ